MHFSKYNRWHQFLKTQTNSKLGKNRFFNVIWCSTVYNVECKSLVLKLGASIYSTAGMVHFEVLARAQAGRGDSQRQPGG